VVAIATTAILSNIYPELLWFAEVIKKFDSQAVELIRKCVPEVW
jgi:hypothetical protein